MAPEERSPAQSGRSSWSRGQQSAESGKKPEDSSDQRTDGRATTTAIAGKHRAEGRFIALYIWFDAHLSRLHVPLRCLYRARSAVTAMDRGPRRSNNVHAGSPTSVMKDATCRPREKDKSNSGRWPKVDRSVTMRPSRRSKAAFHRRSSLELPHAIEFPSSMRQLHSIIRPISPEGSPDVPSPPDRRR